MTTKPWSLTEAIEGYREAGIPAVTVWRQHIEPFGPKKAGTLLRESGLKVVSFCRGGFFPAVTERERSKAVDDNRRAIDEVAEIGAPLLVLVCGAVPGQPLEESRKQVADGIAAILPRAESAGVRLSIEPLHPMYADSRSAVNTLKQANDVVETLGGAGLGVTVDVYHVWWDPDLEREIRRAGANGWLASFHISDWRTPTRDLLNDRALMGEGCIPIRRIRDWVRAAGFTGHDEVELFSDECWSGDQTKVLERIKRAYATCLAE